MNMLQELELSGKFKHLDSDDDSLNTYNFDENISAEAARPQGVYSTVL